MSSKLFGIPIQPCSFFNAHHFSCLLSLLISSTHFQLHLCPLAPFHCLFGIANQVLTECSWIAGFSKSSKSLKFAKKRRKKHTPKRQKKQRGMRNCEISQQFPLTSQWQKQIWATQMTQMFTWRPASMQAPRRCHSNPEVKGSRKGWKDQGHTVVTWIVKKNDCMDVKDIKLLETLKRKSATSEITKNQTGPQRTSERHLEWQDHEDRYWQLSLQHSRNVCRSSASERHGSKFWSHKSFVNFVVPPVVTPLFKYSDVLRTYSCQKYFDSPKTTVPSRRRLSLAPDFSSISFAVISPSCQFHPKSIVAWWLSYLTHAIPASIESMICLQNFYTLLLQEVLHKFPSSFLSLEMVKLESVKAVSLRVSHCLHAVSASGRHGSGRDSNFTKSVTGLSPCEFRISLLNPRFSYCKHLRW